MVYDLKKVEEKFHEYLKARLIEDIYRVDEIRITEENGYEDYDLWVEDNPDIYKKYDAHAKKVKKFNYDDLKFISDVER